MSPPGSAEGIKGGIVRETEVTRVVEERTLGTIGEDGAGGKRKSWWRGGGSSRRSSDKDDSESQKELNAVVRERRDPGDYV